VRCAADARPACASCEASESTDGRITVHHSQSYTSRQRGTLNQQYGSSFG
jgi:hypothetical protein